MGFDSPISPSSIYRDDVPRQEKRRSISYTDEDIQEDYKPFRQHAGIHRFNSFHQHEVQTLSQPPIHLELPDLAIIPDAPEHQEEGNPDQTWVIRRSMAFGEDVMDEDHPLPIKEYSVKRYQSILDEDDDSIFETSCGGAPTPLYHSKSSSQAFEQQQWQITSSSSLGFAISPSW